MTMLQECSTELKRETRWVFINPLKLQQLLTTPFFDMTSPKPTDAQLLAYLDEMLPVEQSTLVEQSLRAHADVRTRAAMLARRRDQGGHTIGEIWRRNHLSCLSRMQLGSYLLGVADSNLEDYILFHTEVVGCRFCQANLDDLRAAQQQDKSQSNRQQRYFESSAGLLKNDS